MREAMEVEMGDAEEALPMAGMGDMMGTIEALSMCACSPSHPVPTTIIYF